MLERIVITAVFAFVLLFNPVINHAQEWKTLTKKKHPTFFEIREAAARFYKSMDKNLQRKPGFKQFKRWEWFTKTRLDKDGYFDPTLNWKGWLEKKERFGPDRTVANADWTPLGPVKVPTGNNHYGGLGRLNCIAFDPRDANIIWVGAPTGGLWKSGDGGQTWITYTDYLPNLGVSDIVIHPGDPDIMYIATGDKQRGSTLSLGVMKSTDGGRTWEFTGLNPETADNWKISKLIMHPHNHNILLAAANNGIYKTNDSGMNWEQKLAGDFHDMEIHPTNPVAWYAAYAGNGIYKSEDEGENWRRLTNGLPAPSPAIGRINIAVSASSPETLYALYCTDIANEGWVWGLYGIYRSQDSGENWTLQANSPNLLGWEYDGSDFGGQGAYALILDVKPSDPNVVYVGSINMWKSTDGGVTWRIFGTQVHVDHHDFAFLPGSSTTIFSCNDGGLFKSEDEGDSWRDLSNGLAIHQVYRLALSPQDPDQVVLGSQDNGSSRLYKTWTPVYGGDGADCLIDPNDDSIIYCASQFGRFARSTNGGQYFSRIFPYLEGDMAWLAPLIMNPTDPSTLYTASRTIFRSIDHGFTSMPISESMFQEPVIVMAVSPANSNYIFASDGTTLIKTMDGGNTWIEMNTEGFPTFITGIALHPHNPEIAWVTFGGYGRWNSKFIWNHIIYEIDKPKVFYTNDGGATWQDVSGDLPNIPANCIEVDPFSLGVYVGTDLGVFYSQSGIGDWKRFDNGLPNVIVTDMEIHKTAGKIVAGTYGRGVWESPLASPPDVPGIYPPLKFSAQSRLNRSLLQSEFINVLSWLANPLNNKNNTVISFYRVYLVSRSQGQANRTLLAELDANTFEYILRQSQSQTVSYALTAVDNTGRESDPLYITLRQ